MRRFFLTLLYLVVVSYGDTTTVFIDTTKAPQEINSTEQERKADSLRIADTSGADSSSLDPLFKPVKEVEDGVPEHKKKRYRVVSAVMMMIFVGIAMGTSQSNNPK